MEFFKNIVKIMVFCPPMFYLFNFWWSNHVKPCLLTFLSKLTGCVCNSSIIANIHAYTYAGIRVVYASAVSAEMLLWVRSNISMHCFNVFSQFCVFFYFGCVSFLSCLFQVGVFYRQHLFSRLLFQVEAAISVAFVCKVFSPINL